MAWPPGLARDFLVGGGRALPLSRKIGSLARGVTGRAGNTLCCGGPWIGWAPPGESGFVGGVYWPGRQRAAFRRSVGLSLARERMQWVLAGPSTLCVSAVRGSVARA